MSLLHPNPRRHLRIAAWLVLVAGTVPGGRTNAEPDAVCDTAIMNDAHRHFEWGEYDSLIARMAPFLENECSAHDSSESARLHSYLGVAFFAKKNIAECRNHFARAVQYDRRISLDSYYVSSEILAMFEAVLHEQREAEILAGRIREGSPRGTPPPGGAIGMKYMLPALCVAVCLSSGGAAYYFYDKAGGEHSRFSAAARAGDLQEYARSSGAVKRLDAASAACGSVSFISGLSGIYFLYRAMRQPRKPATGGNETTFSVSFHEAVISWDF